MKINGVTLESRNEVIIPILRNSGNIYFLAYAVSDHSEFLALMFLTIIRNTLSGLLFVL